MSRPEDRVSQPETSSESAGAMEVDLEKEFEQLRATNAWQRGKSAKRLTPFPNFRVSLFALAAQSSLGQHHNAGRVTIQPIRGHLHVTAGGKDFDVPVGRMVVLDRNVPHDVEALEESAFLVTVALEDRDQLK